MYPVAHFLAGGNDAAAAFVAVSANDSVRTHCNVLPLQVPAAEAAVCPLADFLAGGDDDAAAFVAVSANDTARGLIATTSAVDTAMLLEHFDLDAHDGLLPAAVYDEVAAAASAAAAAAKQAAADADYDAAVVRS